MKTNPASIGEIAAEKIIDQWDEAIMFYMGRDCVIRISPWGGTQFVKIANEKDLLRLPRVESRQRP